MTGVGQTWPSNDTRTRGLNIKLFSPLVERANNIKVGRKHEPHGGSKRVVLEVVAPRWI